MWVFGYGSLMWDGWENARGCIRRARAELSGYRRVFNKPSIRNWGTEKCPCPTLNLVKADTACCCGLAFEFPDYREQEILKYLTKREGRDFVLHKLSAQLEEGDKIEPLVFIYEGKNLIPSNGVSDIAELVLLASGTAGSCISYVKGVADELRRLGINDPAVSVLWQYLTP